MLEMISHSPCPALYRNLLKRPACRKSAESLVPCGEALAHKTVPRRSRGLRHFSSQMRAARILQLGDTGRFLVGGHTGGLGSRRGPTSPEWSCRRGFGCRRIRRFRRSPIATMSWPNRRSVLRPSPGPRAVLRRRCRRLAFRTVEESAGAPRPGRVNLYL